LLHQACALGDASKGEFFFFASFAFFAFFFFFFLNPPSLPHHRGAAR